MFVVNAIFTAEIEDLWKGTFKPILETKGLRWVLSAVEFLATFWGGVLLTLCVLAILNLALKSFGLSRLKSGERWDPECAISLSEVMKDNFPVFLTEKMRSLIAPYNSGTLTSSEKAEFEDIAKHRRVHICCLFAAGKLIGFGKDKDGNWVEIPPDFWSADTSIDGKTGVAKRNGLSFSDVNAIKPQISRRVPKLNNLLL